MAESRRHAVGRVRWWAIAAILTGGVVASAAVSFVALTLHFARTVVTPPKRRKDDTNVLAVDDSAETVTLSVSPDAILPGDYGFWFDGESGYARLGEIVDRTARTVTRRIISVNFGDLASASSGRFSGWFFLGPSDLDFPFEDVRLQTTVGLAPAWLIPARGGSGRWVIQVHGRAASRAETLRAVPLFHEAGFTSLLISYRNDGDAPSSPDGRYGLGDTEWADVDAAIKFALDHGAEDVVLMGWSMGAATVLQAITRRANAAVRGLVLDSPVVDWVTALDYQAEVLRLPRWLTPGVYAVISRRWGRVLTGQHQPIDLRRLDFVRRADELTLPILLLHSDDDGFVPSTASRALAEARPDIVTLEAFQTARHTRLWNYDRDRWERVITRWLSDHALSDSTPTSARIGRSPRRPGVARD